MHLGFWMGVKCLIQNSNLYFVDTLHIISKLLCCKGHLNETSLEFKKLLFFPYLVDESAERQNNMMRGRERERYVKHNKGLQQG